MKRLSVPLRVFLCFLIAFVRMGHDAYYATRAAWERAQRAAERQTPFYKAERKIDRFLYELTDGKAKEK